MNFFRLFRLTLIQNLKRPIMICILLIMLLLCLFITGDSVSTKDNGVTILYYIDESVSTEDSSVIFPIRESLESYDGIYNFVEVDSIATLNDMILKQEAECGYIIPANISTLIFEKDAKHSISVILNPSSTLSPIVNETVYSLIFPNVSAFALNKYLDKKSAIRALYDKAFDENDVFDLYKYNATNGSTFTFNYVGQPTGYNHSVYKIVTSPLRGLLSVFVVISGFIGALAFYKESRNPIFSIARVRLIYIFIPCLLTGIEAYLGNFLTHKNDASFSAIHELIAIALLICLSTIYVFVLSLIIKSELLFSSVIPVFTIATLVFTPIFINISSFISILKPVSYILPNYYYLIF